MKRLIVAALLFLSFSAAYAQFGAGGQTGIGGCGPQMGGPNGCGPQIGGGAQMPPKSGGGYTPPAGCNGTIDFSTGCVMPMAR